MSAKNFVISKSVIINVISYLLSWCMAMLFVRSELFPKGPSFCPEYKTALDKKSTTGIILVGKFSIQIMSTVGVLNKTIPTKKCTTKYVHGRFLKTASYSGHFVVRIKAKYNLRLKLDREC